ncbi:MAG: hypothetical protein HND58_18460 [Planctomycetota bacterium]|nr:MAG: hypothetical protein HND58_18460 [Planctomycetota bacterium]
MASLRPAPVGVGAARAPDEPASAVDAGERQAGAVRGDAHLREVAVEVSHVGAADHLPGVVEIHGECGEPELLELSGVHVVLCDGAEDVLALLAQRDAVVVDDEEFALVEALQVADVAGLEHLAGDRGEPPDHRGDGVVVDPVHAAADDDDLAVLVAVGQVHGLRGGGAVDQRQFDDAVLDGVDERVLQPVVEAHLADGVARLVDGAELAAEIQVAGVGRLEGGPHRPDVVQRGIGEPGHRAQRDRGEACGEVGAGCHRASPGVRVARLSSRRSRR